MDVGAWVFRSEWHLHAASGAVFTALADVENYPRWWPQVRSATRLDDGSGELVCRSRLPYDLNFTLHREVEDIVEGVLRARLSGDLVGTCQWTIRASRARDDTDTVAIFDEDADLHLPGFRQVSRLLRPVLRGNHDHMMRDGETGLRGLLEVQE